MRNEGVKKGSGQHAGTEVAKGFFWQTPGSMLPYIAATIIYVACGQREGASHSGSVSFQFRLLFAIGAVPAVIVAVLSFFLKEVSADREKTKLEWFH